jgi:hypothetical protein
MGGRCRRHHNLVKIKWGGDAGGITDCSRWLSEATPPDQYPTHDFHPGGMADSPPSACYKFQTHPVVS